MGTDGHYHDNTPENRELYPAIENAGEADEAGTVDDTGSEVTPVASEPAPAADDAPAATAKTRKQ
jgi:hypothetical protein